MGVLRAVFALVTLGYLAFATLSMLSWKGRAIGARLILAGSATAAWALTVLLGLYGLLQPWLLPLSFAAETVRAVAWLWFLAAIAQRFLPIILQRTLHFACWMALVASCGWWLWPLLHLGGSPLGFLSAVGFGLSFLGLVVLEQLYRNADMGGRSALRYLVVGLGVMFVYDLYLYAQTELLREFYVTEWLLRGVICLLALPCVVIATRRSAEWSVDIFVSRQVVFYSSAFTAVGLYLLCMAAGGYYIRRVGGTWGGAVQLVFMVGSVSALLMVMFSVSLRRRVRVFIAKHFYRNKYDYRVEWLKFIQTLSEKKADDEYQGAVRSIAQVVGCDAGLLFLEDESRTRFTCKSYWSDPSLEFGAPDVHPELCIDGINDEWVDLFLRRQWIVDLDEYRLSPDAYGNAALPGWLVAESRWRVVVPLFHLDRLTGFVVLSAPPAPFELTYEDIDLLRILGRQVAVYLAQHEAAGRLKEIGQFEAVNRLTAFMMHDLKNAVAQMSLVVRNAERHKHNPDFIDDAIGTIANANARIERLIEQLRQGSSTEMRQRVLLERVIDRAMTTRAVEQPVPVAQFVDEDLWVDADFERLSTIVGHLIRNAQEATPPFGEVTVSLERHEDQAWIVVTDSGEGMDETFVRERLFKPFDSTKGTRGMGIGAYQAREYVHAVGGDLRVKSNVGEGTAMTVRLPLASDE